MSRQITCRKCGGSEVCKVCGGSGEVDNTTELGRFVSLGLITHTKPCDKCYGDGKCNTCDGTGKETVNER